MILSVYIAVIDFKSIVKMSGIVSMCKGNIVYLINIGFDRIFG
jgi:hypothetical protein